MSRIALSGTTEQALLGEGARWDARRDELLRVDIVAGHVFRDQVNADGSLNLVRRYNLPGTVGAVAPIDNDDGWLVAADRSLVHLALDGELRLLADVAPDGTRLNDGACDPHGRFWAGTLAHDHRLGGGSLYRFDGNGQVTLMLEGLTISNGLDWSPAGTTMYLADSGPGIVHSFNFDAERGTISDQQALITVPQDFGAPDGLTVDAGGDLWVAIYGGGCILRYAPNGTLRETLSVPAKQSTSCAFAGPGLHRLYVTTATEDWTDEQRQAEPTAGLVYHVETDATGRPAALFQPDRAWWSQVMA